MLQPVVMVSVIMVCKLEEAVGILKLGQIGYSPIRFAT